MFAICEEGVAVTETTNPVFRDLMRTAYGVADRESTDTSTRVGAVIIDDDGNILVSGANAFINPGMAALPENHVRPRKYGIIEHAERAAIYSATLLGIPLLGRTMICPWACCSDCARGIVLSGIKLVIAHQQAFDLTPDRWREEVDLGIEILENCGVSYTLYDGEIGNVKNLFNGEIWYP